MRRNFMVAILSVFMSAMISTMVLAEDVYVTKFGKKYHKAGSRFIKNKEVEKISREEAEEQGYEPSSDFLKKDADLESEETQETQGKAKK